MAKKNDAFDPYLAYYQVAKEMSERIVKSYGRYNVPFSIKKENIYVSSDRFKYEIKLLPGAKVSDIKKYKKEVQMSLKLPFFQVVEEELSMFIIISWKRPEGNHLCEIWQSTKYIEAVRSMGIAHPVGINDSGEPVVTDLETYPHAMVCGTTQSGKTSALKSLLLSLVSTYKREKINLLICDGAYDLGQFNKLPHLSYPIVEDPETFCKVILILEDEMERRIRAKDTYGFEFLPSIVCVIDEFNKFIRGINDKWKSEMAANAIAEILRRGRHARIHLVLASHNPTKKNARIDMSDIPTKLVFQVSQPHNSVAALGKGGAEKLKGKGDMLFSIGGETQHLQGAFISSEEIETVLAPLRIRSSRDNKPKLYGLFDGFMKAEIFVITDAILQRKEMEIENIIDARTDLPLASNTGNGQDRNDSLFAKVVLWTLGQDSISCNLISETFGVGWRRANGFIKRLQDVGIVGNLDAKLPREVVPQYIETIPEEVIEVLLHNGISFEEIADMINRRGKS